MLRFAPRAFTASEGKKSATHGRSVNGIPVCAVPPGHGGPAGRQAQPGRDSGRGRGRYGARAKRAEPGCALGRGESGRSSRQREVQTRFDDARRPGRSCERIVCNHPHSVDSSPTQYSLRAQNTRTTRSTRRPLSSLHVPLLCLRLNALLRHRPSLALREPGARPSLHRSRITHNVSCVNADVFTRLPLMISAHTNLRVRLVGSKDVLDEQVKVVSGAKAPLDLRTLLRSKKARALTR
jgi:hypothetical protein